MPDQTKNQPLTAILESLIFASEKPISVSGLYKIVNTPIPEKETNRIQETLFEESSLKLTGSDTDHIPDEMSFEEVMNTESPGKDESSRSTENSPETPELFSEEAISKALSTLELKYKVSPDAPIGLVRIGDGYQLRTNPAFGKWIRLLKIARPVKLTRTALETMAIVAYKQPITKNEIDSIRGVDCGYSVRFLLDKKLIRILGRKDVPGRPILYGTTNEFLSLFGLKNLSSLPTLREFRELTEKHAEKVKELFEESSTQILSDGSPTIDPFTEEDAEKIAEIDRTLAESRRVKSVDKILEHDLFKDAGQIESESEEQTTVEATSEYSSQPENEGEENSENKINDNSQTEMISE